MIMKAQVHSYGNEVSKRMYCLKCRRSGHLRHECRTRYCDFCKMYGHQKSDCFRLEEKLRRQQQQQQEENYSEEEACDAANVLHTKPTGNSDECDDYDFGFTAVVHSQAELEPGCKRRPVQYRGRRADERPAGCKFRPVQYSGRRAADKQPPGCKQDSVQKPHNRPLIIDSGASRHLLAQRSHFVSYQTAKKPYSHTIQMADGTEVTGVVIGRGDAVFQVEDNKGMSHRIFLKDALHVPTFNNDVLSVSKATNHGESFIFNNKISTMSMKNGTVIKMRKYRNIFL
ncbi:unnamed protein product [Meganyctiphanes norvegica]|uniref:CCHC-type domain-containing protein n=1 Tax=Meganyctiphanes norvegica TaxID=48144 RepID=A0AAV2PSZ8_MEGNR